VTEEGNYDSDNVWTVTGGGTYTFEEGSSELVVPYDTEVKTNIHIKILDTESDYFIDDVKVTSGGYASKANGNKDYMLGIWTTSNDVDINVYVTTADEKYTNTFYLKIDNPELANIYTYDTNYNQHIFADSSTPAGVFNAIKFDAATETQLYIYNAKNTSKGFYKLYKNEEDVTDSYNYGISFADGDYIEVKYDYPDVTCHVTFTYADEASRGCILGATVDGENAEDFTEDGFSAKMGSSIVVKGNTEWYNVTEMSVNGVARTWISFPYSFKILEDTEISLTAETYPVYSCTVTVDDPNNVKLYRGYTSSGTQLAVEEGANVIEVSSNNTLISIAPKSGVTIESIKNADGEELYPTSTWSTTATFYITDGMELTVTTSKMERNNQFVLYFDDPSVPANGYNFQRGCDRTYLNEDDPKGYITAGYHTYYFGDTVSDEESYTIGENVFSFACYDDYYNNPDMPRNLYVNDEKIEPTYASSASWTLTLSDKDVVKLFFASNPEFSNVSFDVADGVDVSVVKDLITEASTEGFQALPDTQVDLKFNTTDGYNVYLNGEQVEVNEDAYSFNVSGDTVVKVELSSVNGVSSVSADSSLSSIYNLQGIKVGTDRNYLPAGIYILNGKKIAIK
jgi:hypothetical protein